MPKPSLPDIDPLRASRLGWDASAAFILMLAGAATSFGYNMVLARLVGAEATGLIYLGLALVTGTSVISRLGLDNIVLRRVAQKAALDQWDQLKQTADSSFVIVAFSSALLSVVLFGFSEPVALFAFKKPELAAPLRWLSIATAFHAMVMLHSELLRGIGMIRYAQFFKSIALPMFAAVWLLFLGKPGRADLAAIAYVVGAILAAAGSCLLWRTRVGIALALPGRLTDYSRLVRQGRPLLWESLTAFGMTWLSPVVLGFWGSSRDVGVFSIAWRTSLLVGLGLLAANAVLAPRLAQLHQAGRREALGAIAEKSAMYTSLFSLPVVVAFVLFPEAVMGLFGEPFLEGKVPLAVMAVSQYIGVLAGSVGILLLMSGNERAFWRATAATAVIYAIAVAMLVPTFGAIGAAYANATALISQNVLASYSSAKALGILPVRWIWRGISSARMP